MNIIVYFLLIIILMVAFLIIIFYIDLFVDFVKRKNGENVNDFNLKHNNYRLIIWHQPEKEFEKEFSASLFITNEDYREITTFDFSENEFDDLTIEVWKTIDEHEEEAEKTMNAKDKIKDYNPHEIPIKK